MVTVSPGIVERYEREFGVRATLITNAPKHEDLEPSIHSEDGPIRIVHHGGAHPNRNIEGMIEVLDQLDERFTLDLVLVPTDLAYVRKLEEAAAARPRLRILAPVPMPELPRFLNRYDIGLYILPPANFNARHALPNKLFEFVQGRPGGGHRPITGHGADRG